MNSPNYSSEHVNTDELGFRKSTNNREKFKFETVETKRTILQRINEAVLHLAWELLQIKKQFLLN